MVTTFTFVTKVPSFHMTTTVTMGAMVTSFKVPVLTKAKMFTGFCGYINMTVVSISVLLTIVYMNSRHQIQHAGQLPGEAQHIIIYHLCWSTVQYIQNTYLL